MQVLVLGQSYEPIGRVEWERAMTWWVAGRVEILEAWEGRTIRTPRLELPMPSVVRFLRSRRRYARAVRFSRETIYARDRGQCQYCQRPVGRARERNEGAIRDWKENLWPALKKKPKQRAESSSSPDHLIRRFLQRIPAPERPMEAHAAAGARA